MPHEIRLTNTLTGKKEVLETLQPGRITFYSCGPTVYNLIHVGNLRGGLVADLAFRYFRRAGYEVVYVRNYTDVDDKIIQRAKEEGIPADALARKYTVEVEKDYAAAGMLEPTHKTAVTTHMPEIIRMIERIIEKGHGYVVDGGEVLFSIEKFQGYGKLSQKHLDDLIAGIRVEVNDKKRSPLDFTLWKPAKPGEPWWESPWSKGRPGWHIECSAMSSRWLGEQIDVHHGGEDLIFPHHENEIAQSEAASGKAPFVRYWLHHAFLTLSKEKMSKSLGNVFSAREFLKVFNGEVARYLLLSVHYRSPIDFCEETIEQTLAGLQRIYEAKAKAESLKKLKAAVPDLKAETAWGSFVADCEAAAKAIDDHYANDLNASGALSELFTLIREFNRLLTSEPQASSTPGAVLGASALLKIMDDDIGAVLGVARALAETMLRELGRIRAARPAAGGAARPSEAEIQISIHARNLARKAKNFTEADRIRKDLEARGVEIKDSPAGTTWKYS